MDLVHADQRIRRDAIAPATRARLIRTISDWSDEPGPQFSPSNTPEDAPPGG
jgi:hypothetical protein